MITQGRELSSQVAVITALPDPRQPLYVQPAGRVQGRHSLPEAGAAVGQRQKFASVLPSELPPPPSLPSKLPESEAASVSAPEPPAPALPSSAEVPIAPPDPPEPLEPPAAETPPLADVPPALPPASPAVPPVAPAPLVPAPASGCEPPRSSASPQPAPSANRAAHHTAMPRSNAPICVSIASPAAISLARVAARSYPVLCHAFCPGFLESSSPIATSSWG